MRRILFSLAVIALWIGDARAAALNCKEFTASFSQLKAGTVGADLSKLDPRIVAVLGFVRGVFHGATNRDVNQISDPEMRGFELAVLDRCKTSPDAAATETAYQVAAGWTGAGQIAQPVNPPSGTQLSATSREPGLTLVASAIQEPVNGMTEVVLSVRNDTDDEVSVSVRCSLYAGEAALGEAGAFVNSIPPKSEAIGTARGMVSKATRADCRIIRSR